MPIAKLQEGLGGKARAIWTCVLLGLFTLVCVLVLVPAPLKMDARGQLLPSSRRWVYSADAGAVKVLGLQPNQSFPENFNLLELYSFDVAKVLAPLYKQVVHAEILVESLRRDLAQPDKRNDPNLRIRLIEAEGNLAKLKAEVEAHEKGLNPFP